MTSNSRLAKKPVPRPLEGHARLSSIEPLAERHLSERIAGKRIIMVFCDEHFEENSRMVSEMAEHGMLPKGLSFMKWSDFYLDLPMLKADAVIVTSLAPDDMTRDPAGLATYLSHFRKKNPKCSVVMLNLYGKDTPAGSIFTFLEREGLVDRAEPGPVSYDVLLRRGTDLLELKTL